VNGYSESQSADSSGPARPNPLANARQIELERRAVRIWSSSNVQRAKDELRELFLTRNQARLPAGAATLQPALEEMAFAFLLRTLNSDPHHPEILWDQNVPHSWFGIDVPGSRCTGHNPDNIYRRIPIATNVRYELSGRRWEPEAAETTFSLLPDVSVQHSWSPIAVDGRSIATEPDGSFLLTLDADPPKSRANHIQLLPGTKRMTIRESMLDWEEENPYSLSIRVVGITSTEAPENDTEIAERVATRLKSFVAHWLEFIDGSYYSTPPNALPMAGATGGGLATQISAMGNYSLGEDEVLVLNVDRLDAQYSSLEVLSPWMFCTEYRKRTGSLNHFQAVPDSDQRYTFVIALHDPGVHNWLDTNGLGQGCMQMRWQGLPPLPPSRIGDAIRLRRVRLADLPMVLPNDTKMLNEVERRHALQVRAEAHDRRFF